MTTTTDERRRMALETSAQLRHAADLVLVADDDQVARALVYVRRIMLELDDPTGTRPGRRRV